MGEIDAMRLMLLRHAKSEKAETGMPDRERRLNARGRRDAEVIGAYLQHHALVPDHVVVSTAERTRETWKHLAGALSSTPPASFDDRLYDARTEAILEVARSAAPTTRSLLLVAHNPGLHDLARLLIASGDAEARERLNEGLPTCGLVVIDFAGHNWHALHPEGGRLERFVSPRLLMEAGRA
jgi:phosphohistidine phosphatase